MGTEVSTTAGHVLGLGVSDPLYRFSGDAKDALEDVHDLGGFAFVTHPTSPREDFRWTGWDLPGGWGIEVLNGDTEARRSGALALARTALLYPLNPRYALLRSLSPDDEALRRWDALLAARPAPAVAGADAHARVPVGRGWQIPFPSYRALFSVLRTYALLDAPPTRDPAKDGAAVVQALGAGHAYVALDALAPADGFGFWAEAGGRRWQMGDTVAPVPGLRLKAGGRVPTGVRVVLERDGREAGAFDGGFDLEAPGPGVYRVEARVAGWAVPWVITNAITVADPARAAERAARAAWPAEPPAPAAAATLDAFEGPASSFHAEFDPSSTMAADVLAPGAGADGGGAARLQFRLGAPVPGRPYTWCALVSREARDLSGREGLVFSIKGDRVYRLWVQVRDANPASADEGTEWWFASVRTSPEWRRVAIPFTRFRSINPNTDGRLDLDKVRQIVFVVDPGAERPGTSGTILIDALGVY